MPVTLQTTLPTSEILSIEAEAGDQLKKVRHAIASSAGLQMDSFALVFDGEVLKDERLVGELPFEDQSSLQVVVSKKQAALVKLSEMGLRGNRVTHAIKTMQKMSKRNDESYSVVLGLMADAGLCNNLSQLHKVMMIAVINDFVQCAKVLLENTCVDVRQKNDGGESFLHMAAYHGNSNVALLLLQNGADPNVTNEGNRTPLHHATTDHNASVINTLLDYNADINARDACGKTALHLAAIYNDGHLSAETLLSHGADNTVLDNENRTAYDLASHYDKLLFMEVLCR
eukprot:TRINITY_DN1753_c0_g1_i1.p1 TRINITY_DN1753_c0_g1~~TRINITY_DN1753_c0_g1_i1.p1  ORF type:complete len:304 (+),score=50.60 TRINITY_DN1753_c0_g1_i1:55-912(+)